MKFSEKLYLLRKKSALSQEQLADRLDVSRQAISKWEGGIAFPEGEKLISISEFFGVSLDDLLKDDHEVDGQAAPCVQKSNFLAAIVLCIVAAAFFVCFLLWMILVPRAAEEIAASSVITLDGRAIILLVSGILLVIGIVLLLKTKGRNT